MTEQKPTCENCKYFCKHYFIFRNSLKPAGYGNCLNTCTPFKKRHRRDIDEGCENWEPDQIKKTEQKERIEDTIREMSRHLKQILQILKTDS